MGWEGIFCTEGLHTNPTELKERLHLPPLPHTAAVAHWARRVPAGAGLCPWDTAVGTRRAAQPYQPSGISAPHGLEELPCRTETTRDTQEPPLPTGGCRRAGVPFPGRGGKPQAQTQAQEMGLLSKRVLSAPLLPQLENGRRADSSQLQFQTCCCKVTIKIIATSPFPAKVTSTAFMTTPFLRLNAERRGTGDPFRSLPRGCFDHRHLIIFTYVGLGNRAAQRTPRAAVNNRAA